MSKKTWLVLLVAVVTVAAFAPHLFAYGEDIETAGKSIITWLRNIGGLVFVIGLSIAAIKGMVMHQDHPFAGLGKIIWSGLILFMATSIYNLLKGWTGGQ